jgi:hypothetical protein
LQTCSGKNNFFILESKIYLGRPEKVYNMNWRTSDGFTLIEIMVVMILRAGRKGYHFWHLNNAIYRRICTQFRARGATLSIAIKIGKPRNYYAI